MDDEELKARVGRYAADRSQRVIQVIGSGLHGMVCLLEGNGRPGQTALKLHRYPEPYRHEKEIYERLRDLGILEIRLSDGQTFQVPRLLTAEDDLLTLEMTVVTAPYILDFASGDLDTCRDLPEGFWEEWDAKWAELWSERWESVQLLLARLQGMGIYMFDPSPSNVKFE